MSGHACNLYLLGLWKVPTLDQKCFQKTLPRSRLKGHPDISWLKDFAGAEIWTDVLLRWLRHLLPYPSKLILKALQSFGLTWWTRCTFLSCYSCIYILKEKNGEVLNPLVTGKLQQRRFLWTFVRNSDQSDIHLISYLAEWIENNKTEKFGPIRQGKGKFSSVVFSFNFVIFIEFCLVARIF